MMDSTLDDLLQRKAALSEPRTVCLLGSTRYTDPSRRAILSEMLYGKIVVATYSDEMVLQSREDRIRLELLHLQTIDRADEVLVLHAEGHSSETTLREIEYAARCGKQVRWLEPPREELLQLVMEHSRSVPVHSIFCVGIADEMLESDLTRAQKEAVFARFGQVIRVRPMVYGEVAELVHRHTQRGETVCLLFDLEQAHLVDLSVDLALFIYEQTGKKPICISLWKNALGEQGVTVKYPSPT